MQIRTERLRLVPSTVESVRAEMADRARLAVILDAVVPPGWPLDSLAEALPWFEEQLAAHPEAVGWYGWYALLEEGRGVDSPPVLVGSAGFLGAPGGKGQVEIGYSVQPDWRCRGLAGEMVRALAAWAFSQSGVARIIARTAPDNPASVKVLLRSGFAPDGMDEPPASGLLFRLERPDRR
ncbi:GNAT family N-acetyltransferase [bacterium]|nr:GNAT family N-acetyltransferase [bacterium]